MPRTSATGLTFFEGQYRISCGYWYGQDGKRKPRVFRLGTDEETAHKKAIALRGTWRALKEREPQTDVWTPAWLERAERCFENPKLKTEESVYLYNLPQAAIRNPYDGLFGPRRRRQAQQQMVQRESAPAPAPSPAPLPQPASNGHLIHDSVDCYLKHLESRVPQQLSRSHYERQTYSMKCFKQYIPDGPLSDLTYDLLASFVGKLTARPASKRGQPMAIDTVTTNLRHAATMLRYLEDSRSWAAPNRWEKLFDVRVRSMMTPAEKKHKNDPQTTVEPEQLKKIWAAAQHRKSWRLWLLVGLNTCSTQQQLAQFLLEDWHLDEEQPYVDFCRGKTGTRVMFDLWPETGKLVRERIAKTPRDPAVNPEGLAFMTEDGFPLVRYNQTKSKIDAVRMSWSRLIKQAELEGVGLSFKVLRKTTATAVLNLSGNETLQQQALAHQPTSVAAVHYTGRRDFAAMNAIMKQWYEQTLKPIFSQIPKRKTKPTVAAAGKKAANIE